MTSQITKMKQPLNRKACGPVLQAFLASERILPSDAFAQLLGIKPETEAQMRARRQSPPFFRCQSQSKKGPSRGVKRVH
jgi:hypothetical protein